MIGHTPRLEHYRALAFDLDGTLYPTLPGLTGQFDASLRTTVMRVTGCSATDVGAVLRTMRAGNQHPVQGLARASGSDPGTLLEEIYHRLDLEGVTDNPLLASTFSVLAAYARLIVVTNSSKGHATRVLRRLGLSDLPVRTYGMEDAQYRLKPDPFVYQNVLASEALAYSEVLYFDDSGDNVNAARAMGMPTVHVVPAAAGRGSSNESGPAAVIAEGAWISDDLETFLRKMTAATVPVPPADASRVWSP